MKIAVLTTDNREHRKYEVACPYFGPAIEALLQGLANIPELEIHVVSCTQRPMQSPEKLAENIWFHLLDVPKIGWLRTDGFPDCFSKSDCPRRRKIVFGINTLQPLLFISP
jgi:hypothetical protein